MKIIIEKSEIAGFLALGSKIYLTMAEVIALYTGKANDKDPSKKTAEDAMNALAAGNATFNQDNLSVIRNDNAVTITISSDYVLRHFAWVGQYYEALAEIATIAAPVLMFAKNKMIKVVAAYEALQRDAKI